MVVVQKSPIAPAFKRMPLEKGSPEMTRTKNRTGKPAAATSAAHAAPAASPRPGTGPAAGGALEAVRAALAASNGDGATTASIAATAGVSRAAASKALTTLEKNGTARRGKGTGRGAPDTWHPAEPGASGTAAGPGSEAAAGQPGPGINPAEPAPDTTAEPAPPASDPGTPPADGPAAPPPPGPAVLAAITENASQIGVAASAIPAALEAGDLGAARRAIEEIRDQAATALRAVKAAAGGSRSGPAARPGQLRELVAAHLAAHPGEDFTPHEIAKVIERSSGAVANALDRLTELGQATLSCEKPRRYRHVTTPATAPSASPTPAAPGDEPQAGAA
jgi:predicted transcriptional regulator